MASTILVTATDGRYHESVMDLARSVRATGFKCDIGIIDFGLRDGFGVFASEQNCLIHRTALSGALATAARDVPQGWKAALLKPHIRDIFTGYETYIFLDADTWVQQRFALDYLQTYSRDGSLAIVSQRSRFHEWDSARGNGVEFNMFGQPLRANWYTMFSRKSKLPAADKRLLASRPILNAGVFALRGDAPLWDLWQQARSRSCSGASERQAICRRSDRPRACRLSKRRPARATAGDLQLDVRLALRRGCRDIH